MTTPSKTITIEKSALLKIAETLRAARETNRQRLPTAESLAKIRRLGYTAGSDLFLTFEEVSLVARAWECRQPGSQRESYARRPALVLLNGLAEQPESWFRNLTFWRRHFDVYLPNLLVYDGPALHGRIDAGLPINVEYLVEQLRRYLEVFVQMPPYHLVAASLGGKIAVEFAARYPQSVGRIVLLCPSGMGDKERLPLVESVRIKDVCSLVESVFYDPRRVDPGLLMYYQRQFVERRWRRGLVRTARDTRDHCVRDRLAELPHPTLIISGSEDHIVDPKMAESASKLLPNGCYRCLPRCGHAPQMEQPRLVNRLVRRFLLGHRQSAIGSRQKAVGGRQ
jgi:pimeloyl-ACP methyl ester carboxylesterase